MCALKGYLFGTSRRCQKCSVGFEALLGMTVSRMLFSTRLDSQSLPGALCAKNECPAVTSVCPQCESAIVDQLLPVQFIVKSKIHRPPLPERIPSPTQPCLAS